ncbi:hypothetical protein, partial [Treponema endosymbiont of Eucomonympha sp.]|uniref:hypothetical protein n=1 Tax=Treponema endosymbiont of Eucomonympha sp. TaxID=1580831 RepID=UPI000B0FCF13
PAAPQDDTRTVPYAKPSVLYEGERNAGLYIAACALLAKYDNTPEARAAYDAIRCEPELPHGERDGIYSRAKKHHYERKASGKWKPSASGNAEYTLGISREAVQDGGEHAALFAQAESVLNGRQWHNLLPVESTAVSALADAAKDHVLHDGNDWLI